MSTKLVQRRKERSKLSQSQVPPVSHDAKWTSSLGKWLLYLIVAISLSLGGLFLFARSPDSVSTRFSGLNFAKRWGTFRSGVYFGLKRNEPASMVTGLMWFKNGLNEENTVPIRHLCSKFDPLKYIWRKHDFDSFGIQEIEDGNLSIKQQVLFREDGYIAKIGLNSAKPFPEPVSLVLYFASENPSDFVKIVTPKTELHRSKKISFEGSLSAGTKQFLSRIDFSDPSAIISVTQLEIYLQPPLTYFQEYILSNLRIVRATDGNPLIVMNQPPPGKLPASPNFLAVQIIVTKPIELFFYLRESIDPYIDAWMNRFDADMMDKVFSFTNHFDQVFQLREKNYNERQIDFAQSVMSNMLGSVGYFYGHSVIRNGSVQPVPYGPLELTSAVPSRSYFPRGFLWDEGFHQLLIGKMKPELTREIIKNWLNLMDSTGWIPREVILGLEALSRVPQEFVIQDVSNANPPSLLLPIEFLFDSNQLDLDYLKSIYPLLERWFGWFNTTQVGLKTGTYRWRGRDPKVIDKLNPLTLTSGLDDYPRASHPTEDEIHLDLRCWITIAARILYKIGQAIEAPSAAAYEETFNFLRDNRLLDQTHWSEENQMYCDFGLHSNKMDLQEVNGLVRRVAREKPIYRCVAEPGYISLFPMILNLLDADNPRLNSILNLIESSDHLWTPYGIRSISSQSSYYLKWNTLTDPPYWRGPIWININFLVLRSLKYYARLDGPYSFRARKIHDQLRDNLVNNVFKQYEQTSFVWEHYNDTTGQGGGVHPFTGWSALIILIMSDQY